MHNILIPVYTFLVALIGNRIISVGMKWAKTLKLPKWCLKARYLGWIWMCIYFFATLSALIVWNWHADQASIAIGVLFLLNGVLNVLWNYIFFVKKDLALSVFEASALNITIVLLIYMIMPFSMTAALLLVPYFVWVTFATYLSCKIKTLNI